MRLTVIGQVVDLLADLDTVVAVEMRPWHMVLFTVIIQDLSRLDAVSPLVHTRAVRLKVKGQGQNQYMYYEKILSKDSFFMQA